MMEGHTEITKKARVKWGGCLIPKSGPFLLSLTISGEASL